jgi:hypothetical protein
MYHNIRHNYTPYTQLYTIIDTIIDTILDTIILHLDTNNAYLPDTYPAVLRYEELSGPSR